MLTCDQYYIFMNDMNNEDTLKYKNIHRIMKIATIYLYLLTDFIVIIKIWYNSYFFYQMSMENIK